MASEMVGYMTNIGMSMLFGLGYYLAKKSKKPIEENNESNLEKNQIEIIRNSSSIEEINESIKNGNIVAKSDILSEILKKDFPITIDTYNLLLSDCLMYGNLDFAEKIKNILLEMLNFNKKIEGQDNLFPNTHSLCLLIKQIGIETKISMKQENSHTDQLIDISFSEKQNFDLKVRNIVSLFNKNNIKLDISCHNSLMLSLIKTYRFDDAWRHYLFIKKSSTPDIFTYIILTKGIKNLKDKIMKKIYIDKINMFLDETQDYKDNLEYPSLLLKISDILTKYTLESESPKESLMNYEFLLDKYTNYIKDFKFIEQIYSLFINTYSKIKEPKKALEIFDKLREISVNKNFKLTSLSYASIINCCSQLKTENWMETAYSIFQEMYEMKIEINHYVYSSLINGFKRIKNFKMAYNLYIEILKSLDSNSILSPSNDNSENDFNTVLLNTILDCCVECGEYKEMENIYLRHLKCNDFQKSDKRLHPDKFTYSILLKGYSKMNNCDKVMEIYNYLKDKEKENVEMIEFNKHQIRDQIKNRTLLDEVIFNTILDSFVYNNNQDAFNLILNEMKKLNISRSVVNYGIIIKNFAKLKDLNKVNEIFTEMIENGIKPNIIIYQTLFKLNSDMERHEDNVTLYKKLINSDVKPDSILTNHMIDTLCRAFMINSAGEISVLAIELLLTEIKKMHVEILNEHNVSNIVNKGSFGNSEFVLGISSNYKCIDLNAIEVEKDDQKIIKVDFSKVSKQKLSKILDISSLEFFIWGLMEEKNMMYFNKKIILEKIYEKLNKISKYLNFNFDSLNNNELSMHLKKLEEEILTFFNDSKYETNNRFKNDKINHYKSNYNYNQKLNESYKKNHFIHNDRFENINEYNRNNKYNNFRNPKESFYKKYEDFFTENICELDTDIEVLNLEKFNPELNENFDENKSYTTHNSLFKNNTSANYYKSKIDENEEYPLDEMLKSFNEENSGKISESYLNKNENDLIVKNNKKSNNKYTNDQDYYVNYYKNQNQDEYYNDKYKLDSKYSFFQYNQKNHHNRYVDNSKDQISNINYNSNYYNYNNLKDFKNNSNNIKYNKSNKYDQNLELKGMTDFSNKNHFKHQNHFTKYHDGINSNENSFYNSMNNNMIKSKNKLYPIQKSIYS